MEDFKMKEFFKSKELWTFVGGAVTAVVTSKFAKSNKARELAVKGLASGMQVKDNVEATVTSIKEVATQPDPVEEADTTEE
jgi:hypothetical protein